MKRKTVVGMAMNRKLRRRIEKIVGRDGCETAPEDLACYRYDAADEAAVPDMVVHPQGSDQVAALLELASEAGLAVVPRGAGTGLSGGSLALEGGLVLAFDRMNRILEIDTGDMLAVVEPGVVNRELRRAASASGLFYPPDPSSLNVCTLGGNVAENAGGPYGTKYGVTGDYVLGLEAFLAGGRRLETGGRNRRDVAGYDLTSLLVGSEGTLAVVTRITLKLLPAPRSRRTALFSFSDVRAAADAVSALPGSGVVPAAAELMDATCIDCVEKYRFGLLPAGAGAALLVEVDGDERSADSQLALVRELCREAGGNMFREAAGEDEAEAAWEARRAVSPALGRAAPDKIGEDVSVPPSQVASMVGEVREIAARHGLTIAVFGHAADGNLHPNILTDRRDPDLMRRTEAAVAELFAAAVEMGGTLSGEHGIGTTKARFLETALQDEALATMRAIKQSFDPEGILNPGKMFPSPLGA